MTNPITSTIRVIIIGLITIVASSTAFIVNADSSGEILINKDNGSQNVDRPINRMPAHNNAITALYSDGVITFQDISTIADSVEITISTSDNNTLLSGFIPTSQLDAGLSIGYHDGFTVIITLPDGNTYIGRYSDR